MRIRPKQTRLLSLAVATIFALPISFGWLTGIYVWTSPLVVLDAVFARRLLSPLLLLGAVVLILVTRRHRWYCRWMCPVGVLCDAASKRGPRTSLTWLPRLGIFMAILILAAALLRLPGFGLLDPIVIFQSFFNGLQKTAMPAIALSLAGLLFIVSINFFSKHIWCTKLCPLGGLQDLIIAIKKIIQQKSTRSESFDLGRRAALGVLGGFGLGVLMKKSRKATAAIRPPGALSEGDFQTTCLRCGNCIKACPTDIIQSGFEASDLIGLLTPVVSFSTGYCLTDCTNCGRVCPSGAIRRFSKADKKSLVMGIARIDIKNCLLSKQQECDRCRHYCDYDAVTIQTSETGFQAWPEVDKKRCVGCGACVLACPERVIEIRKTAQSA